MMRTEADTPNNRLLKTKMFTEQLIVSKKKNGAPGQWEAPIMQTKALDVAINEWIDETGNELVQVTTPNIFMQWMDADRTVRVVVATAMVTYVPAVKIPTPVLRQPQQPKHTSSAEEKFTPPADWEPLVVG